MESTKNTKNTSKLKFTLTAKNVIPSSPGQGLYSSMISNFTNESIKKPMLLPSIKGNKKNNNMLISTQIKQMKSISQRISSNGFGVNGFNIRNIKSKTKPKINKTSKTKTIFKKINNNNTIYDMSQSTVKKKDKKTKPQQICQWFHFTKTNNLYLFIPNSKYISHINNNSFISSPLFQITNPMSLPEAFRIRMFKYTHMPICITSSMNKGGVNLTKYVHKSNVLWKLIPTYQMRELLRQIHPNIKFNHFPATFQLGRKDNLFRNYRRFNNIFPKEYNYVPNTYLLPYDAERFQNDFMLTKKNHKKKWIVKPANLSCGKGIHILKGEKDFLKMLKLSSKANSIPYLISKYISNPHIINNKKYDLRIYVLITSFTPLKIFLFENGLVRFATEDYKNGDYDNIFIHLTNYSVNKKNIKYKKNNNDNNIISNMFQNCCEEEYEENISQNDTENNCLDNNDENQEDGDPASKWSLFEFKQYFLKNNIGENFISIWKGIKDIVIKTLITNKNNTMREIPYNKTTTLFEVYGFDIIIDNKFRPWLLEVNVNPSLHCSSPLDMSIKTDLITDVINIIGIKPIHHQIQDVSYTLDGTYKTKLEIYRKCGNICEQNIKGKDHSLVRMEVMKGYEGDFWKWKKIYNKDCYKKMIEYNEEEEERVKVTGFERIFPDKQNIGKYSKFINCNTGLSDWDIVFWSYLMNKENKKEVNFMNEDKEEIRQEKNEHNNKINCY